MSERVKRLWLALAYLGIIILATPQVVPWWYQLSFWLFAGFLLWVARPSKISSLIERSKKLHILLGGVWILLLATRIIPFLHFGEAPLGYDTGIYLRNFERAITQGETTPLSVIVHILSSAGFSTNAILHGFLIVFNILLGLALYTTAQSVFKNRLAAVMALLIFTLSIAQYEAYIWMFYRMMLSMMLFMETVTLIARRSYLAILTGGFAGALHPATFLVFGTAYVVYTMIILLQSRKAKLFSRQSLALYVVLTGFSILALALLVNFPEFRGYLTYLTDHKLQLSSFEPYLSNELTGFYLNFIAFRASTMFYTPLALLGVWSLRRKVSSGNLFILAFFFSTLAFIVARVVFYQRYLIILDILIILFASITLARIVEYFQETKWERVLIGIFVIGFSGLIVYYSWTRTPWIPPEELRELKTAAMRIESNAYGMATDAYYTPWVYGYLTERTIAPGYFINYWSLDEWKLFWYKGTDEERLKLLAQYGKDPLYIFVGSKQPQNKPLRQFLEKYTVKISEHIWKYSRNQFKM